MTQFGPPIPGRGKNLRQILKDCEESDEQLKANPLWKQGFEDGYAEAMENHRQLSAALHNVYRIDRFGE